MTLSRPQLVAGVGALVLAAWFVGVAVCLPWLAEQQRRACIERNREHAEPLGPAEEVCQ